MKDEQKKTRLQAFLEAQREGQIAISKETAGIMAGMLEMDEAFWNIVDVFQSPYPNNLKAQEEISDRYYDKWRPLRDEILKGWLEWIDDNCLAFLDFKAL